MVRRGGCAQFFIGLITLGVGAALGLLLGAVVGEHASLWQALVLPGALLAGLFGWGLVALVVYLARAVRRRTLDVYVETEVPPGAFMLPVASLASAPLLAWSLGLSPLAWASAALTAVAFGGGCYALARYGLIDPSFLDGSGGGDAAAP